MDASRVNPSQGRRWLRDGQVRRERLGQPRSDAAALRAGAVLLPLRRPSLSKVPPLSCAYSCLTACFGKHASECRIPSLAAMHNMQAQGQPARAAPSTSQPGRRPAPGSHLTPHRVFHHLLLPAGTMASCWSSSSTSWPRSGRERAGRRRSQRRRAAARPPAQLPALARPAALARCQQG